MAKPILFTTITREKFEELSAADKKKHNYQVKEVDGSVTKVIGGLEVTGDKGARPAVSTADSGKVLGVNASGEWEPVNGGGGGGGAAIAWVSVSVSDGYGYITESAGAFVGLDLIGFNLPAGLAMKEAGADRETEFSAQALPTFQSIRDDGYFFAGRMVGSSRLHDWMIAFDDDTQQGNMDIFTDNADYSG